MPGQSVGVVVDPGVSPEIERLSRDADQLDQALRRSLHSAHEAFRHLDP